MIEILILLSDSILLESRLYGWIKQCVYKFNVKTEYRSLWCRSSAVSEVTGYVFFVWHFNALSLFFFYESGRAAFLSVNFPNIITE
jgi:hypothetical protein